ncbi:uncharacterized protein ARMOST_02034 [Armillaria ostoyae]|uniref:Uncharacterized protein n=1 Tax=Armillaria ostoyae TaxID=47428 RepID=A0A284QQN1_ARMOS|nr:uncharacterized protein ARMOST_02034 [Armillaria ostoyae]
MCLFKISRTLFFIVFGDNHILALDVTSFYAAQRIWRSPHRLSSFDSFPRDLQIPAHRSPTTSSNTSLATVAVRASVSQSDIFPPTGLSYPGIHPPT